VDSEWKVKVPPRFEVKGELGRGGMAVVFHAYDTVGERDVALKFLPRSDDEELKKRFQREATDLAVVFHPNVVDFYSLGESEGQEFIEMEYVGGGTLDRFLRRCESLGQVLEVYAQVCDGLQHIHENGLVHRDIKPANILMAENDVAKISDLGLARQQEGRTQLTQDGTVLGTAAYLAPEQLRSHGVDHRADLYAVGCCLFEAVTGRRTFIADTPLAMLRAHLEDQPTTPSDILPGLPPKLDQLILSLLEKKAENRPPDARTVAQALREIACELTPAQEKLAASSPTALLARVQHHLSAGEPDSALRLLERLNPSGDDSVRLAALVAWARGKALARDPQAFELAQEAVQKCRDSGEMKLLGSALVSMGMASSQRQDWDGALSSLQEARGLVPSNDHGLQMQMLEALAEVYESGPQKDEPEARSKAQQFRKIASGLAKRSESFLSRSSGVERSGSVPAKPAVESKKTKTLSKPAKTAGKLPMVLGAILLVVGVAAFFFHRWYTNRPALIKVDSDPPGAAILIDDQRYYAPLTMELPKGEHTLKIFKQGYKPREEVINLEAGGNFQLKATLESASGEVNFTTKPEGATVLIDGQEKGKGPLELKGLAPRTYSVKVSSKGYIDYEGKVEVIAGQSRNLSISLKKIPPPPPPPPRATYYPQSSGSYNYAPRRSSGSGSRRRSGKGDGYFNTGIVKIKNPF